jgi:S-DNA-T family DNA segregation ATPase FtsK/SpoIIIE
VDGWERLAGHGHGGLAAQVRSLLEGSGTTGLRAVVTGGRTLLAGHLVPVLPQRLVLALADPVELAMAGIPGKAVPLRQPPGRALDARTHREVHIATLEGDANAAAGVVAERWAHGASATTRSGWPRPIRRLPETVTWAPGGTDEFQHNGLLAVGVRDGDLATVGFHPAHGERRILVVGPPGSGRTTVLRTLTDGLGAARAPIALIGVAPEPHPPDVLVLTGHGDDDVDRLVSVRRAHPDLVLLVDDAERLSGQPIEPVLLEIARRADEDRGVIVAATTPLALDSRTTALGADLARAHTGVVLWPSAASAVLGPGSGGTESPVRVPGRGILVGPSGVERIQVAMVSRPR